MALTRPPSKTCARWNLPYSASSTRRRRRYRSTEVRSHHPQGTEAARDSSGRSSSREVQGSQDEGRIIPPGAGMPMAARSPSGTDPVALLKSTLPPENSVPPKSISLPEHVALAKDTLPPVNVARLKSTVPPAHRVGGQRARRLVIVSPPSGWRGGVVGGDHAEGPCQVRHGPSVSPGSDRRFAGPGFLALPLPEPGAARQESGRGHGRWKGLRPLRGVPSPAAITMPPACPSLT